MWNRVRLQTFTTPKAARLLLSIILLAAGLPLCAAVAAEVNLLNVSYDVTREFYQEFNPAFAAHWKTKTGGLFDQIYQPKK